MPVSQSCSDSVSVGSWSIASEGGWTRVRFLVAELTEDRRYSQVDMLGLQYKFVKFGLEINMAHQIDVNK